jgi:hypothetical protein
MKINPAFFFLVLIGAARLNAVADQAKSFGQHMRRLSSKTKADGFPKENPNVNFGEMNNDSKAIASVDKSNQAQSTGQSTEDGLRSPSTQLESMSTADSKSGRKLTTSYGLNLMHLVVGSILTTIMFGVLGYCTMQSVSTRNSDDCGVVGWLGGGMFATLGLKYILDSAKNLSRKLRTKSLKLRSLKKIDPAELEEISKSLFDKDQVEKILSPNSFSKVFDTTMKWVNEEDLKNLDPSDSKGIFKYVRKLLHGKFPNSKAMLDKSIRDVQRLSGYFKK